MMKRKVSYAEKLKREFYEGMRELRAVQEVTNREIDRVSSEIDKLHFRISSEIDKVNKMVGKLTDGWGKFVEGLVEPSIPEVFRKIGIEITGTFPRAKKCVNGETMEIDILASGIMNGKEKIVIAVECKSDLGVREIKECEKDLSKFFDFFDEYRGRKLIGAVAGIRIIKGAVEYAEKRGLYILSPSGNIMKILNKERFKPRIYTG
jgi:hypothetical protein